MADADADAAEPPSLAASELADASGPLAQNQVSRQASRASGALSRPL